MCPNFFFPVYGVPLIIQPQHDKTNKWPVCPLPSKDSDQLGHLPSLIRVFTVRMKKAWTLSYPGSAQQRLWSDWGDAGHFVGFVMLRLNQFLLYFRFISRVEEILHEWKLVGCCPKPPAAKVRLGKRGLLFIPRHRKCITLCYTLQTVWVSIWPSMHSYRGYIVGWAVKNMVPCGVFLYCGLHLAIHYA